MCLSVYVFLCVLYVFVCVVANVCACDNGFPTAGTACPKGGAAMCKGCNIGFTIDVGKTKCECKAKQTDKTKCGQTDKSTCFP